MSSFKFTPIVFDNIEKAFITLSEYFVELHNSTTNRNYIVPGGSTPIPFFKELAKRNLEWNGTKFILSDERLVAKNDHRSNRKMIINTFEVNSKHSEKQPDIIVPTDNSLFKNITPELSILGIGTDGHTASLFPNNPNIFSLSEDQITYKTKKLNEEIDRISLTFSFLLRSKKIIFLVLGKEKAEITQSVLFGAYDPLLYPVQYILQNYRREILIYCDNEVIHATKN